MPATLNRKVYTTAQIRAAEQQAVTQLKVSLSQLMQRAAQACLQHLQAQQPAPARVVVLCGPGNNGGDGWVLARLAQQAGYQVQVFAVTPRSDLAQLAAQAWHDSGGISHPLAAFNPTHREQSDVVVDAVFGSGLNRSVTEQFADCIAVLNTQPRRCWVLSIDIPSGLNSDTGRPCPIAVRADWTVSFIALTLGLVTGQAAHYCGHIELAELGIASCLRSQQPVLEVIDASTVVHSLPARAKTAHKGDFGHVVVIGGGPGMSGAAILAGQAALRCGAGKVSIACHPTSQLAIAAAQPEFMVHAVTDSVSLLLSKADVVVIGPGLGQSEWAQQLVIAVADWDGTVVWDADGLNLLAALALSKPANSEWVMTPHPGEAGRLLRTSTAAVEQDRWHALTQICQNFQAHALLKGAGTLVKLATHPAGWVCRRGSPALATGGSGDVLSGVVAALLAQRLLIPDALVTAVWLHAVAGELASCDGERGTIASDLLLPLRQLSNPAQWSAEIRSVINIEDVCKKPLI